MQGEIVREFSDHVMQYVPKIPTVILVIALGVLLIRLLDNIIRRMLGVVR